MIPSNWITEEVFIHFILKVWGNHDDFDDFMWQRGNVATVSAFCSVSVKSWFICWTTKLRSSQLGCAKSIPSDYQIKQTCDKNICEACWIVVIPCHCWIRFWSNEHAMLCQLLQQKTIHTCVWLFFKCLFRSEWNSVLSHVTAAQLVFSSFNVWQVTLLLVTIAFPAVPFWRSPSLAPRRPQARSKSSGPTSTGDTNDSYDWQVSMPFLFLIVILFGPVVHSGSVFMCSWVNYL